MAARKAIVSTPTPNSSMILRKIRGRTTAWAWLMAWATDSRPSDRIGWIVMGGTAVSCRRLAYPVGPTGTVDGSSRRPRVTRGRRARTSGSVLLGDLVELGLRVLLRTGASRLRSATLVGDV